MPIILATVTVADAAPKRLLPTASTAAVLRGEAPKAGLTLSDKFDRDSSMRALFRCDHLPFLQKGVPAIWLFGGFHPGYHEPADTIGLLDFDKMERAVRLTVGSVRKLAAPGTPPRFRY